MTRIRAVCTETIGQSGGSLKTLLNQTGKMFRLAATKLSKGYVRSSERSTFASATIPASTVTVPEYADVVIIGGGNAGCNALYQLAKNGVNAVLLERAKLTSGTTWHSAGLFWNLRPNDVAIELLGATKKLLTDLETETGTDPGWINNGGIYIAHNKLRMDEYKRLATAGKSFGIETHLISPRETRDLFPLLDENAFHGALYTPADGVLDPTMLSTALTKAAKNYGAKILEECPVSRIFTEKSQSGSKCVTGVETPYGTIRTNCVLNAAGVWSRSVAKMVGVDIPLIPMKHAYVVTEPMEGVKGLPNIRDHDSNVYFRVQGSSLCLGGYELNPIILQPVPKDFTFGLYELDWNIFSAHMNAVIELLPKCATAGIKTTICGPESFTPDHLPIMGEDPRCTGFFYSCGYNSAGMMYGAGCGEQAAMWIINGRPLKHMYNYDIRRFTPDQTRDLTWANERSHESYVKNYSIVFPHDQPLAGRNFKRDSIYEVLLKEGAVMEESQGWERPGWFLLKDKATIEQYDYYGSYGLPKNADNKYAKALRKEYTFDFPEHHQIIGQEALACRNNVALFDISSFGKFYLCGPEVQLAADYLFTANTNRDVNRTTYTCTLNKHGGVEADCTVTAISPGSGGIVDPIFKDKALYIVVGGTTAYQAWAHMNQVIREKGFNASLHDLTSQIGILSVQGPNSRNILEMIVDKAITDEDLPFSTSELLRINGNPVRTFRISYVGELGFELHIPTDLCRMVYENVRKCGRQYKMKLAGYRAMYSLSCEKGYHLWNSDLRTDDNPVEANLGFLCRKDGDYLGKEAVERLRENGVKRRLVHFHIKDHIPLWGLEVVYRNGRIAGYMRRGDYSYTFQKSIGQAYIIHHDGENVTKDYLQTGDYEIEIMGKRYPAQIYLQSPFDPHNKRLSGVYED